VIIPTFNRAQTIKYCIDSVLVQTFSHLEVIVIDDCSTDDTVKIVNSYSDLRVRCLVLEKNSGAQAARNRGIKEAKGDWIAFQDSDDEWSRDKLEKQVRALSEVNYDPFTVVHTNAIWLDTSTGDQLTVELPVVEGPDVYPTLLTAPGPLFPTMLVSRLALEKIGYLDENVPSYQEWDTSIRLAKYCRFIYLKEPLFIYHLHTGETISKNKKREIDGYQFIIHKFENEIKTCCGQEIWEKHLFIQLVKCLNFKLWAESDQYFNSILTKNLKYRVLKICRLFHIRPEQLLKTKRYLTGS